MAAAWGLGVLLGNRTFDSDTYVYAEVSAVSHQVSYGDPDPTCIKGNGGAPTLF